MDKHYTVRQACEMTGVKAYVLRYWEDEMELCIGRNELGHRYYTGYDIQLFLNIKELKSRGLQLRAIKDLLPKIAKTAPGSTQSKTRLLEGETKQTCSREEHIETGCDQENIQAETVQEICQDLRESLKEEESEESSEENEKILEFQQIMERLIAQELIMKNDDEERCRSLDAAIRKQQLARREAAAAVEKRGKKEKRRRSGNK